MPRTSTIEQRVLHYMKKLPLPGHAQCFYHTVQEHRALVQHPKISDKEGADRTGPGPSEQAVEPYSMVMVVTFAKPLEASWLQHIVRLCLEDDPSLTYSFSASSPAAAPAPGGMHSTTYSLKHRLTEDESVASTLLGTLCHQISLDGLTECVWFSERLQWRFERLVQMEHFPVVIQPSKPSMNHELHPKEKLRPQAYSAPEVSNHGSWWKGINHPLQQHSATTGALPTLSSAGLLPPTQHRPSSPPIMIPTSNHPKSVYSKEGNAVYSGASQGI